MLGKNNKIVAAFLISICFVMHLGAESITYDVTAVKNQFNTWVSNNTYSNNNGYYNNGYGNYYNYNAQTRPVVTVAKQAAADGDPIKTFLAEADKQNISEYEKESLLDAVIQQVPECFCVVAYHMLQAAGIYDADAQAFIEDWQESLGGNKEYTQTTAHLTTPSLPKPVNFFTQNTYQPQLIQAALKERELNEQGYYVFYHGQQNFFGFYQDFGKKLLQECYKKGIVTFPIQDDFFFIRTPEHLKDIMNGALSKNALYNAQSIRNTQFPNYSDCLSVNGFLFGSTSLPSCSTWNFVVTNSNCSGFGGPNLGKEFFEKLGYKKYFNQFEKAIKRLNRQNARFFNCGRLLQIAIPTHLVDECVFISSGGASKTSITIPGPVSYNGTTIDKVSMQMPYCLKRDINAFGPGRWGRAENHFCIFMTEDLALNPQSGIKVFGYNGIPAKSITLQNGNSLTYAQYSKSVDALIEKIVQAFLGN